MGARRAAARRHRAPHRRPVDLLGLGVLCVGLALSDTELVIDAADEGSIHHGRLDLATGEVAGDGMHADAGKHLPKRLVHWAVDTVRAVPWIGPAPIAWLERASSSQDSERPASSMMRSHEPVCIS